MSHSLAKTNIGNNAVVIVTITNYVNGGESFTLAELGLTTLSGILFLVNPQATIVPQFKNNLVYLVSADIPPGSPIWQDIPSQVGINYLFAAVVTG